MTSSIRASQRKHQSFQPVPVAVAVAVVAVAVAVVTVAVAVVTVAGVVEFTEHCKIR